MRIILKGFKFFLLCACVCAMIWGCGKDKHLNVQPEQLYGEWTQDSNTDYHWTYNNDGTGNLVNTGEFDPEDENNGDFTWTINNGDELEVEFKGSGALGGIDIVKLYTIREITATTMRWEDIYGRATAFTKIR